MGNKGTLFFVVSPLPEDEWNVSFDTKCCLFNKVSPHAPFFMDLSVFISRVMTTCFCML